jgi:hypothetical protein
MNSWNCLSVRNHRSYFSNALTYSYDKNLNSYNLCCSFEHLVTIWINEQINLNEESDYKYSFSLSHYDKKDQINYLISYQD